MVTDEIYEHLTYDGARSVSMPVEVPELADTCVVLNGVAKTYAMTGWRVGWMIGPRDVIKAATNLQSHATSNVANVSQRAAIAALNGDAGRRRARCRSPSTGAAGPWSAMLNDDRRRRLPDRRRARSTSTRRSRALLGRTIRGVTPHDLGRAGRR